MVHPDIVCPPPLLSPAIVWSVLAVVEQCIQLVLSVSSPPSLVFETKICIVVRSFVREPHRKNLTILVVFEDALQTSSVTLGQIQSVGQRIGRMRWDTINGNRR